MGVRVLHTDVLADALNVNLIIRILLISIHAAQQEDRSNVNHFVMPGFRRKSDSILENGRRLYRFHLCRNNRSAHVFQEHFFC